MLNATAAALGELKDPRAVEPLITLLQQGASSAKFAAAALGQIGDPRAVPALISALESEDDKTRTAAAHALHKIRWPRPGLRPWLMALVVGTPEPRSCSEVAEGLTLRSFDDLPPLPARANMAGDRGRR